MFTQAPGTRRPPKSRNTAWAMSQANVEAFKRAFDAINSRDAEALLAELDPEVEWHGAILMAMGGDRTVYRGHEGRSRVGPRPVRDPL